VLHHSQSRAVAGFLVTLNPRMERVCDIFNGFSTCISDRAKIKANIPGKREADLQRQAQLRPGREASWPSAAAFPDPTHEHPFWRLLIDW